MLPASLALVPLTVAAASSLQSRRPDACHGDSTRTDSASPCASLVHDITSVWRSNCVYGPPSSACGLSSSVCDHHGVCFFGR